MTLDPHGGGVPVPELGLTSSDAPPGSQLPQLRRSFGRAIVWAAGSQLGQLLIQFPVTIVLSRLLVPRDFGLMAMVLVISQFVIVFVDAGLGSALVHQAELEQRHISTAFWINVGIGGVLCGLMCAAAPGIAALYGQPRLTLVTIVLSANFLVASLGIVPVALLQRALQFRWVAVVQAGGAVLGSTAGIVSAVLGGGLWSLVVAVLVTSAAQSCLALIATPARPYGGFDRSAARELWHFGGGQMGFLAINYWNRNADNFLVGRFIGPFGLAMYDRAYQLMLLPISQLGYVVSSVLFPALARMDDDRRVKEAYLRTVRVTALIAFPIVVVWFVTAPELVDALFGHRWHGAARVLRVLCVAGMLQSVGTTTGVIYQVKGRTDWLFRWGLVSAPLIIGSFGVGVHWGVMGVAIGYAAVIVPVTYLSVFIPGRLIELTFWEVVRAVMAPFCAAAAAGLAMWFFRDIAVSGDAAILQLASTAMLGVAVYAITIRIARLDAYRELRELLRAMA